MRQGGWGGALLLLLVLLQLLCAEWACVNHLSPGVGRGLLECQHGGAHSADFCQAWTGAVILEERAWTDTDKVRINLTLSAFRMPGRCGL